MALSNRERVGKGLDLLKEGLHPYVGQELRSHFGEHWERDALEVLRSDRAWQGKGGKPTLDIQALLSLMLKLWDDVFRKVLGRTERTLVNELQEIRNRWAHQEPFSADDTYRAFDSMHRLLTAISAPQAREMDHLRQEILRVRFEEQQKKESRKAAATATEGQPAAGLKPWREVVTPHPDVASGNYQQAEFAADLDQVHRGEGSSEYRDPKEFFRRTFITEGLRYLLRTALVRLSGKGGDPVIELQTNFGGGKTHSMLALYHLFSGAPAGELAGTDAMLQDAGVSKVPKANRAVLVGTAIPPGQVTRKPDGTKVHTLWGELAWQLGFAVGKAKEAYALVAEADANGTSPGSQVLIELFNRHAPCLILIDEWVAYARQLYNKYDLPAGSFETQFTYAQAVSEAAKSAKQTLLVVSIPASDIEKGGVGGQEATERLKNAIGRLEATWRPASAEEGFEIVRRRLFQPIAHPQHFVARDTVVEAFSRLYREQSQEFPPETREAAYEQRLRDAYPIHPELFDRLYSDWSSLDKFQRTRGVLRLMAAVIHELWERQDANLLILPSTIPMDATRVVDELTRYLDDPWRPIIEKDVDGANALPLKLDRENPNLGRYSAARRVARAIYMGSAPTVNTAHPGIDERLVKLGCVQPGENVPIFGDALRRLTDQATHLYVDNRRYWFSTQPSVTRLAQDRAAQQDIHYVWDELKNRVKSERDRGDFVRVHPFPETSADVPDEMEARLVILGPEHPHAAKTVDSPGRREAEVLLTNRGSSPRLYKNMLVFLVPDRTRLSDLEQAIRQYLAWDSIVRDKDKLNLDAFQTNQATTKRKQTDDTVQSRIRETYTWVLAPVQPNPQGVVEWQEIRVQGQESLAVRASRKLKNDGLLMPQYSAVSLRIELDSKDLWKDVDHLGVKKLWEYLATYVYLPRLRDSSVLMDAIHDGVSQTTWTDSFAYADGWDESRKRYLGLVAGRIGRITLDDRSLIVKPDAAQRQLAAEAAAVATPQPVQPGGTPSVQHITGGPAAPSTPMPRPAAPLPKRFHGTVNLDPLRVGRDAGRIAEEVVQHLASIPGAEVEVTLEVHARVADGVPENTVRTITENSRTLKFKDSGFEHD